MTPLIPSIFIGQTINDSINVEQNSIRNKSMHKQQGVRLKFIGRYFYKKKCTFNVKQINLMYIKSRYVSCYLKLL